MATLYPLRFRPLLRDYVWGGRRLVDRFGKGDGRPGRVAETWEICDRGEAQSIVLHGPLAGETLGRIASDHPAELYGKREAPSRFPLLLKFLDAEQPLSVQVHPNDAAAAKLDPPDFGKTEAWVILSAEPGSVIYAGLKRGFDRTVLAREVHRGTTDLCLHRIHPNPGDCIFLPAGAVHALGAGIVVAEIQQSSDTTYRLFDWNRVGADGQARPLHIDQALAAIDDRLGPIEPQKPCPIESAPGASAERLVACDKFILDRWRLDKMVSLGGDGELRILAVLSGGLRVEGDPAASALAPGDCMLLPASLPRLALSPEGEAEFLSARLPKA